LNGTPTLNGKTKITDDSLFGVGSITKTFVAVTILQLQETHQINLDDSISRYFPEYPRWGKITIRQLLNMTSGISNFTRTEIFKKLIENEPTTYHPPSFFVDLAYKQKDEFSPGKGWYYSNTNYYLLGMIIENITKKSLLHEFQQRFFKPLHLTNTYYSIDTYPASIYRQQVHAYLNDKDVTKENPSYYGPAGCMLMNTKDLLIWTQALFTPGKILSKHSLNNLMKTQTVPSNPPKPDGSRYGLGMYSLDIPGYGLVWWYTGVIDGYSSVFIWIPKKQIIIAAQVNRWKDNNFGLLMPGQYFINTILETI
jgi:D-alanyl-D-alanine carboxypeptidase